MAEVQPKADVGVLVAIAEAEQVAAGEINETIGKPKKPEGENAVAAEASGGDGSAVMPDPAVAPQAQLLPAPSLGVDMAPAPSAPAEMVVTTVPAVAEEGSVPVAGVGPGILAASIAPVAAGEAVPQAAGGPVPTRAEKPHQPVAVNPPFGPAAADGAATDAGAGLADAAGKPGEIAAHGHAIMEQEASGEASASATPTASTEMAKPAEAPQQQQQPLPPGIDLSALLHARAGRPEPLGATGLEPGAAGNAQQPSAGSQQDPTGGQPTPLHVVPLEIGLRALAGSKRFDIRLDPAELGRIDVKLDISDQGEVSAKLVVDRVETLHLLQRDARTLERAFEQAGLKPSDAGVDITLRDQGDQSGFRQNQQRDEQAPRRALAGLEPEADDIVIAPQPVPVRRLVRLGGVDLSI